MKAVQARVSEYKKKTVNEIVKKIEHAPIIGILNMQSLPAAQLQQMRGKLRKDVEIFMTKKRLMKIALEQVKDKKKNITALKDYLTGMPALLFTKENPFRLYKILSQSKSPAPAKPGDIAPNDIVVPAGVTPFAPGPIISEFSGAGLKTIVQEGKVAIKEDTVVARKGEAIKKKIADILMKLNIQPMEIGLDLVAIYEDGIIYGKDVLAIDEKAFMENLLKCICQADALSIEAGYITKDNAERFIIKAFREAKEVALEGSILADAVAEEIIERSQRAALIVKDEAKIEADISMPKGEIKETKEETDEIKKVEAELKEIKEDVKKADIPVPEKKEIIAEIKKEEKKIEEMKEEIKENKVEKAKEEIKEIKQEIEEIKKEEANAEQKAEEIKQEITPEQKAEHKTPEIKHEIKHDNKIETKIEDRQKADEKVVQEKLAQLHEAAKQKIELKKRSDPVHRKETDNSIYDSSKLFEELKKKGTLRGIEKQTEMEKKFGQRSPEEIIRDERKRIEEKQKEQQLKERVPSAYELMLKKKNEQK
ncbi:MAG: 50S ribosomal protein L10 [Candidatus Pacearchaeota archaeon]